MTPTAPSLDIPKRSRSEHPAGSRGAVLWGSRGCRTTKESVRRRDAPLDSNTGGPTLLDWGAGKQEEVDPEEIHTLEHNNPEATARRATGSYSAGAGGSKSTAWIRVKPLTGAKRNKITTVRGLRYK